MIRRDVSRIFTGAWEASAISLPIPSGTSIQHNFTPPLKKHLAPSLGISRTATITTFWNGSEQTCTNLENNTPLLSSCRMRQENQRNPTTTGAISKTVFPPWAEFQVPDKPFRGAHLSPVATTGRKSACSERLKILFKLDANVGVWV